MHNAAIFTVAISIYHLTQFDKKPHTNLVSNLVSHAVFYIRIHFGPIYNYCGLLRLQSAVSQYRQLDVSGQCGYFVQIKNLIVEV